jgi:hypothetical protein
MRPGMKYIDNESMEKNGDVKSTLETRFSE